MANQTITRKEIEMWRGHLLGLLPHQTFAMPRATLDLLLDLAAAALSHPAALERARAEERERCAAWHEAQAVVDTTGDYIDVAGARAHLAFAAAIRALGPAPSPEVPVITPNADLLRRVMAQVESDFASAHASICMLQGVNPATRTWPEWSPQANTLRWFEQIRQRIAPSPEAAALPAMPADLRERMVGFLMRAQIAFRTDSSLFNEARALLAELEKSKPDPEPPVDWQPIETVPTDRSKIDVRGPHGVSTLWANPEATSHLKKTFTEWRPYRKPAEESQP